MITGEGTIFAEESRIVGRFGGWTAPESISRDQSTGFESVDAYFDSDNEDSGETSTLHLESPSLHNITLPRRDLPQVSTPFPVQRRSSRTDIFREPPPPPPQLRIGSPRRTLSPSPSQPSVHKDAANEVAKPASRMQDDGYNGEYDASVFEGPDRDYNPLNNPSLGSDPEEGEEQRLEQVDDIGIPSPETLESQPIEPAAPMQPNDLLEPLDPLQRQPVASPIESGFRILDTPSPQSPARSRSPSQSDQDPNMLGFKRARIRRYTDSEGPQPLARYEVPIRKLGIPQYEENTRIPAPEVEELLSDDDGSVASMIIGNSGPELNAAYIDHGPVASDSESGSETDESSRSDSEIEEIVIPPGIKYASDNGQPRRSTRTKIPKLDSWRGEYVVYDYDPETGTRTATAAHRVEPDTNPVIQSRNQPRRRQPITVIEGSSVTGEPGRFPLFDESIRDYQQQILAKSLNPADSDDSAQVPFPESPNVLINTILEGQRGMPVVIAQLTFGRNAAIPPRNSGELWYTFICWTGKVQFTVHNKAVVIQREGAVTIPAGNDFFIENVGVGSARVLMVQATCQDIAEEYGRMDASHLSNFEDVPSAGPSSAGQEVNRQV